MVKRQKVNKTSASTMKKVKAALKRPPCKNNPYGIKCDKRLRAILRAGERENNTGAIQQKQNVNIKIGQLEGKKRRQAKKTVKHTRLHHHLTVGEKAGVAQQVIAQGSLMQQDQRRLGNSRVSYGTVRPDLASASGAPTALAAPGGG